MHGLLQMSRMEILLVEVKVHTVQHDGSVPNLSLTLPSVSMLRIGEFPLTNEEVTVARNAFCFCDLTFVSGTFHSILVLSEFGKATLYPTTGKYPS